MRGASRQAAPAGCKICDLRFRVNELGLWMQSLRFGFHGGVVGGLGFGVYILGFRVTSLGLRV